MPKPDEELARKNPTAGQSQGTPSAPAKDSETEDEAARRWAIARAQIEREFRRRTAEAGVYRHRLNAPLEIEEALTPGLRYRPGGLKWNPH